MSYNSIPPPPRRAPKDYPHIIRKHFGDEYLQSAGRTDERIGSIMNKFFMFMGGICIIALLVSMIFYGICKTGQE